MLLFLYVVITGITIQLIDLKALYSHAPATDPVMQSIHEGIMGPPGFAVIRTEDYAASSLPKGASADEMLKTVLAAASEVAPAARYKWVELRMDGNVPVGMVATIDDKRHQLEFNALTGASMGTVDSVTGFERGTPSVHDTVKNLHRGQMLGNAGPWVDLGVAHGTGTDQRDTGTPFHGPGSADGTVCGAPIR